MSSLPPVDSYDSWYWVGHPSCEAPGKDERFLINHREELEFLGGIEDETLSYEYDEFALVRFRGVYYLLETCGCSCPSPSETWSVEKKGALSTIRRHITRGDYSGYTLPGRKREEFLALIDSVHPAGAAS